MSLPKTLILLTAITTALLSSCYSPTKTALISEKDLKREGVAEETPEQKLISQLTPEPPRKWHSGKAWLITDDRLRIMLRGDIPEQTLAGDTLMLREIKSVADITGDSVAELHFALPAKNAALIYTTGISPETLMEREQFSIPFTVELSTIASANKLLQGKRFYTMTSNWLYSTDTYFKAWRYVPVIVTDVSAGSPQTPLRVNFRSESNPELRGSLLVSLSDIYGQGRDFGSLFSLTNPRSRHSDIYPDVWDLITKGRVKEGMTKEECRLALGNPVSIDRKDLPGVSRETWNYGNGAFVTLEDGVVKAFRL